MWDGKKRMAPGALLCRATLFPSHSDQVTSGEALCRLYTYARKRAFNIDKFANPLKSKQLALITELLCPNMEPRCRVSRGKTGEGETGKRDYRHRSQTGCV